MLSHIMSKEYIDTSGPEDVSFDITWRTPMKQRPRNHPNIPIPRTQVKTTPYRQQLTKLRECPREEHGLK